MESNRNMNASDEIHIDRPNESSQSSFLAWSSQRNYISMININSKEAYANFLGGQLQHCPANWTHIKSIPNTTMLVSLSHSYEYCANMAVYDISQKDRANTIYSFEEALGGTGYGDLAYNSRRNIIGAMPIKGKVAYHLFSTQYSSHGKSCYDVKQLRKAKWPSQYNDSRDYVTSFDFDPNGQSIAITSCFGECLITDVNTNACNFHMMMRDGYKDYTTSCRWSTNIEEPFLYIKFSGRFLNILDAEKRALILKTPFELSTPCNYSVLSVGWIDICPRDGNLLACDGDRTNIKIYDQRESKFIQSFSNVHSDLINCVRWNSNGSMLASASRDMTVSLIDIKADEIIYSEYTEDYMEAMSVCFVE